MVPSEIAQAEKTTKKAETLTATDFYLYDKTDLKNKLALLQEPEDFSEVKVFETCVFFFSLLIIFSTGYFYISLLPSYWSMNSTEMNTFF